MRLQFHRWNNDPHTLLLSNLRSWESVESQTIYINIFHADTTRRIIICIFLYKTKLQSILPFYIVLCIDVCIHIYTVLYCVYIYVYICTCNILNTKKKRKKRKRKTETSKRFSLEIKIKPTYKLQLYERDKTTTTTNHL